MCSPCCFLGHQLASRQPALFKPKRLEIVVQQRVDSIAAGGQVTGLRIDDLAVSPFYQTALRVGRALSTAYQCHGGGARSARHG